MEHLGWLTQNLPKAFDGLLIHLETHVDGATVVVVSHDLEGTGSRHNSRYWVSNIGQSVWQVLGFETEVGEVGQKGGDLLLFNQKFDGQKEEWDTDCWSLCVDHELSVLIGYLRDYLLVLFSVALEELGGEGLFGEFHGVHEVFWAFSGAAHDDELAKSEIELCVEFKVDQLNGFHDKFPLDGRQISETWCMYLPLL